MTKTLSKEVGTSNSKKDDRYYKTNCDIASFSVWNKSFCLKHFEGCQMKYTHEESQWVYNLNYNQNKGVEISLKSHWILISYLWISGKNF